MTDLPEEQRDYGFHTSTRVFMSANSVKKPVLDLPHNWAMIESAEDMEKLGFPGTMLKARWAHLYVVPHVNTERSLFSSLDFQDSDVFSSAHALREVENRIRQVLPEPVQLKMYLLKKVLPKFAGMLNGGTAEFYYDTIYHLRLLQVVFDYIHSDLTRLPDIPECLFKAFSYGNLKHGQVMRFGFFLLRGGFDVDLYAEMVCPAGMDLMRVNHIVDKKVVAGFVGTSKPVYYDVEHHLSSLLVPLILRGQRPTAMKIADRLGYPRLCEELARGGSQVFQGPAWAVFRKVYDLLRDTRRMTKLRLHDSRTMCMVPWLTGGHDEDFDNPNYWNHRVVCPNIHAAYDCRVSSGMLQRKPRGPWISGMMLNVFKKDGRVVPLKTEYILTASSGKPVHSAYFSWRIAMPAEPVVRDLPDSESEASDVSDSSDGSEFSDDEETSSTSNASDSSGKTVSTGQRDTSDTASESGTVCSGESGQSRGSIYQERMTYYYENHYY
ncbi:uncharacterized protein LOC129596271 isoform X2 [Paramacrobiotus metropolitanus]|uniref:uncharacterized protein LOC129596271 isoform X2 n=1 Tax=Paramacrobiotus metropolitanus TaxID=2943436 RepID=UPI002445B52D|nr:uncharacterized protein LOC129596271 isoform X2 [Paramacrobiotus metropolitanus]